jgi:hypothetical protein
MLVYFVSISSKRELGTGVRQRQRVFVSTYRHWYAIKRMTNPGYHRLVLRLQPLIVGRLITFHCQIPVPLSKYLNEEPLHLPKRAQGRFLLPTSTAALSNLESIILLLKFKSIVYFTWNLSRDTLPCVGKLVCDSRTIKHPIQYPRRTRVHRSGNSVTTQRHQNNSTQ